MAGIEDHADLCFQLMAGDEDALAGILRAYGPTIRGVLAQKYRGVLDHGDLEDVLAIALFRMWQHRERFDPKIGSLRVWLFRITENAARDVLKYGWHKARQLEVSCDQQVLSSLSDRSRNNGESVGGSDSKDESESAEPVSEFAAIIREALDLLPDKQRQIVLADAASRDGKVSSQELSQELGIPPATVRVYRRRAIERLRTELNRRGVFQEES